MTKYSVKTKSNLTQKIPFSEIGCETDFMRVILQERNCEKAYIVPRKEAYDCIHSKDDSLLSLAYAVIGYDENNSTFITKKVVNPSKLEKITIALLKEQSKTSGFHTAIDL